jgi:HEAT repeat protein
MGLFVVAMLGVLAIGVRGPRYHRRTLTGWLQQYWDTPLMETQRLAEAQNAVRSFGAKKALPELLKLVEAKDDPVSLWMIAAGEKFRISNEFGDRFLRWNSAEDFWWFGEKGFEIFGTNAAPAAAELGILFNENFSGEEQNMHTLVVERSLEAIGKPADLVICQALTNSNPAIRQWAIDQLALVTDDVVVYIARIKPFLKDPSDAVRRTSVYAIGIQTSAPELAVPLLVEALKDSSVSVNAVNALANFGTNALVSFPILTNLVENGNDGTASAALNTLIIIAPDESLPILTNCIARGKPGINAALRALTDVMPDQALPIVLARLQSHNISMRREAFGLLRRYPPTSQIDSAMQTIATDSDSDLALSAKGFLTEQYETNHPEKFLFPDEPGYNGKRLGEWLETRIEGGGDFTPAAKDAIHQIGTNAIPALLKRLTYARPPYCFSPFQININAASGFIALGEQAKPALPELWLLMDSTNKNIALTAMIATCGTGSNAMPFLIKGLTNRFANVRYESANLLTEGVGDKFPEQRKQAIPLFVKLLNDPDDDVRGNATNQLKELDPTIAAKAGIK